MLSHWPSSPRNAKLGRLRKADRVDATVVRFQVLRHDVFWSNVFTTSRGERPAPLIPWHDMRHPPGRLESCSATISSFYDVHRSHQGTVDALICVTKVLDGLSVLTCFLSAIISCMVVFSSHNRTMLTRCANS